MLAAEVAAQSPVPVLRGTLERAVASAEGRACPLLWRCCLRLEARHGRHEAVRRWVLAWGLQCWVGGMGMQGMCLCSVCVCMCVFQKEGSLQRLLPGSTQQRGGMLATALLTLPLAHPPTHPHSRHCRVFLRAVGACPWSKALWCDGLALLNGHATPKELSGGRSPAHAAAWGCSAVPCAWRPPCSCRCCSPTWPDCLSACCASEYIEVMKDKELTLRTDVFEVALSQLEKEAGGDEGDGGGGATPGPETAAAGSVGA